MAISTRPENGALARNDPMATPLGQMIEPYRAQLAPFLRDGATLERVAAELVLASRKTPNLDKCPPAALVDAVCRALATGGIIGTDVWIVPHKDGKTGVYEPTVMLNYMFKAELVIHAGGARSIDARPVWEGDAFKITYGSAPRIDHEPGPSTGRPRRLIGAYAVAFLGFNHPPKIHYMPLDEIEVIRARSKQWSPAKIKDCPAWYACARVVHQIVKLLPKNPKLRAVIETLDREEAEEFGDARATMERPESVDTDGVDLEYQGTDAGTDYPTGDEPEPKPLPVDRDLAWAMSYVIPGKPEAWGGHGGQELGVAPLSVVSGVQAWAAKHMEKPDGYAKADELEAAATIVMEARTEAEEKGVAMLSEMELPLGDQPKRKAKSAQSEGH